MSFFRAIIGTSIGTLLAISQLGCAGDGPEPGGPTGEFDAIQNEIFTPSCISSSCHSSGTQAGGLSLAPSESYAALVDVVDRRAGAVRGCAKNGRSAAFGPPPGGESRPALSMDVVFQHQFFFFRPTMSSGLATAAHWQQRQQTRSSRWCSSRRKLSWSSTSRSTCSGT